ncbi:MAG: ExbD/TolR family protein [Kiritimatiellia bacterium]|jgi:biopolymer transport protein ExbD
MKMRDRRKKTVTVPLTSMGDIAFLLLIFFILCSNFVKESGIEYQSPTSRDVKSVKESNISVIIDRSGDVYLMGSKCASTDIADAIETLLARREGEDERLVVLRCDKNVRKEIFEPVIDSIARAGGTIVAVGERSSGGRETAPSVPPPHERPAL